MDFFIAIGESGADFHPQLNGYIHLTHNLLRSNRMWALYVLMYILSRNNCVR